VWAFGLAPKCVVLVLVVPEGFFAPRIWRDLEPGGEPLRPVLKPAREIYPSMNAASNRLKQAAPANDPEYGLYPASLLTRAIDSGFADELRRVG
jgi:hypothetical protein